MDKEIREEMLKDFINKSLNTKQGRLFFLSLLETTGVLKPIKSLDTNAVLYAQGQKSIGHALISMLEAAESSNLSNILNSRKECSNE